eukprot:753661-Hanusia_phi.AAC.5
MTGILISLYQSALSNHSHRQGNAPPCTALPSSDDASSSSAACPSYIQLSTETSLHSPTA